MNYDSFVLSTLIAWFSASIRVLLDLGGAFSFASANLIINRLSILGDTFQVVVIEHWEKEIEAINAGSSQVELGRAKELLAHARWRAEREFPSQWRKRGWP